MRQARKSLVAINESGVPIITEIVPIAMQEPTVRKCLLALSARFRHTVQLRKSASTPETSTLSASTYQEAIRGLMASLMSATPGEDIQQDIKSLCCARLLSIFGFADADQSWSSHLEGELSLIEALNHKLLDQTSLGRFSKAATAHADIAGFSVGRALPSRCAWLKWDMFPDRLHKHILGDQGAAAKFTPYEITYGYPPSLTTVIATIAYAAYEKLHWTPDSYSSPSILERCNSLESLIWNWNPPPQPAEISQRLYRILLAAWELIRKACLLFYWRQKGFYSDLRSPLTIDRANLAPRFTHEILFGIESLIHLSRSDNITIANAMLWPLIVAACECCHDIQWQTHILELLEDMEDQFSISHLPHVRTLVTCLWRSVSDNTSTGPHSLEAVARHLGLVVPLF